MNKLQPRPAQSKNLLLDRLPATDFQRLSPHFQSVSLDYKQVLYRLYAPIEYVYFPTNGIVSAMIVMENGSAVEIATIGMEGMVVLMAFLGGETSPNEYIVQIAGSALRMKADKFRKEASEESALRRILSLYHSAYQTQVSFSIACNGLHTIQKRCSRWLLTTADRMESNIIPLTHEFLGVMLGVRRSSVTEVLLTLQKQGLLRSVRGKITILDRPGLESNACECYRRVRERFSQLFD